VTSGDAPGRQAGADAPAPRRHLVAPHRRGPAGPRIIERAAVHVYRAGAWLLGHLPVAVARGIVSILLQASYVLWPSKRRSVNDNFAHVLGRPPGSLDVRRRALGAYRSYARYLIELMRLPRISDAAAEALVDSATLLPLEADWKASGRGLILTTAHIGSLESVARGIARHGWPIAAVADDSSFPELFEHLRRQREAWGVTLIPWRNLRELYNVLRRNEVLTLIVDWGYRADGIPVRLFGAWTTLPVGPAALAAKTGAPIVHIAVRRSSDQRTFEVSYSDPIVVASSAPTELRRATQAIADALEATIAAAPEQWYNFKPIWPHSEAEKDALADRAARLEAEDDAGRVVGAKRPGALAPAHG
jgi:phosphatidylinositol dimannoside acyltransferase